MSEWSRTQSRAALREGWDIFETDREPGDAEQLVNGRPYGHRPFELQAWNDHPSQPLASDFDAHAYVVEQAMRGSALHLRALAFLKEHSSAEFDAVMKHLPVGAILPRIPVGDDFDWRCGATIYLHSDGQLLDEPPIDEPCEILTEIVSPTDIIAFAYSEALAKLICAAPRMADALQAIIDDGGYDDEGDFYLYRREGPTEESDYLDPEAIERARIILAEIAPIIISLKEAQHAPSQQHHSEGRP